MSNVIDISYGSERKLENQRLAGALINHLNELEHILFRCRKLHKVAELKMLITETILEMEKYHD